MGKTEAAGSLSVEVQGRVGLTPWGWEAPRRRCPGMSGGSQLGGVRCPSRPAPPWRDGPGVNPSAGERGQGREFPGRGREAREGRARCPRWCSNISDPPRSRRALWGVSRASGAGLPHRVAGLVV